MGASRAARAYWRGRQQTMKPHIIFFKEHLLMAADDASSIPFKSASRSFSVKADFCDTIFCVREAIAESSAFLITFSLHSTPLDFSCMSLLISRSLTGMATPVKDEKFGEY